MTARYKEISRERIIDSLIISVWLAYGATNNLKSRRRYAREAKKLSKLK